MFDCPKEPFANVRWRIRCREQALKDRGFREAFWQACFDDPLFFFNAVLWVYEPRAKIKTKPFCVAAGTLVVTDRGPVPIESVTRQHLLWDGETWVTHGGVLCMGRKPVIMAYGLGLTSDHKVWTKHGWQAAGEGHERAGVQLPDGYRQRWGIAERKRTSGEVVLSVRMRNDVLCRWSAPAERQDQELRMLEGNVQARAHEESHADADLLHVVRDATALLEPEQPDVASVRWAGDKSVQAVGVVRELSGGYGGKAEGTDSGADQQRRRLRAGELPLGQLERSGEEQVPTETATAFDATGDADRQGDRGANESKRVVDLRPNAQGDNRGGAGASTAVVYDILNTGLRHAFTVIGNDGQPLLVHNCLWPHQAPVILKMDATLDEAMENERPISLTVPKSRAQGATYIYLGVFIRRALKDPGFAAGLVTRNEELVDSRTDADAVMYKLCWMLDRLPQWMLPDGYQRNSTEHTVALPNGSVFSGYAATGDVARGGRKTAFAFDEPGSEEFVQGNKDYKIMSSVGSVSNCLAEGTLVVTNRGPIPIEQVTLADRVWDGNMWVSQDGCLYRGQQKTIRSYRISLTPDHRVLTTNGWTNASEGFNRAEIRLPDGYRERYASQSAEESRERVLAGSVQLREGGLCSGFFTDGRQSEQLPSVYDARDLEGEHAAWNEPHVDSSTVVEHAAALHQSQQCGLSALRWTGNRSLRSVEVIRQLPCGHGSEAERSSSGEGRQRQGLLPRELLLGDDQGAGEQSFHQRIDRNILGDADNSGDCVCGWSELRSDRKPHQEGLEGGFATGSIPVRDHLEAVYDLLNCGPRRAFTVLDDDGRPLLVHNCTFLVSTFGLDSGVFFESAMDPDNQRIVRLDWRDNPEHSRNAYIIRNGEAKAVRQEDSDAVREYIKSHGRELKSIERRGHKMDGKVRSPWYDAHCLLPGGTPRFIARELDMDPRGAVGKLFDADLLDTVKRRDARPPVWQGKPLFDPETLKLTGLLSQSNGPLKLWFKPGVDNSAPLGPFSVGCDIAMGSDGAYSSNSVASIIDDRTGEQVGEYTIMGMQSIVFARNVVGLCRWLRNAKLGWEDSGVSGPFAKEVMETICYGNIYYREVAEIGSRRKTRKAGWRNGKDEDKADLFEKMALAMEAGKFIVRSEELIRECGEYEWEKGKIIHRPTKNLDQSEKAHGDRAIGAGVAWLVYSDYGRTDRIDTDQETGQTPEVGSWLWRERQERPRVNSDSPEFSIRDVMLT